MSEVPAVWGKTQWLGTQVEQEISRGNMEQLRCPETQSIEVSSAREPIHPQEHGRIHHRFGPGLPSGRSRTRSAF